MRCVHFRLCYVANTLTSQTDSIHHASIEMDLFSAARWSSDFVFVEESAPRSDTSNEEVEEGDHENPRNEPRERESDDQAHANGNLAALGDNMGAALIVVPNSIENGIRGVSNALITIATAMSGQVPLRKL